jgi:hypothetical protein
LLTGGLTDGLSAEEAMSPGDGSGFTAGVDYAWTEALGSSGRLALSGAWRALSWLEFDAGLRLNLRDSSPWAGTAAAPMPAGPVLYADAQFLGFRLIFDRLFGGALCYDAGIRLQRTGLPLSSAMYLAVLPYNGLDLKWIYTSIGLSIRSFWDPGLPAGANQFWEYQPLARIGGRIFLGDERHFLWLEAHTGTAWEQANLQSLGAELGAELPLDGAWRLVPTLAVGAAGMVSLSPTFSRFEAGLALRWQP